MLSNDRKTGPIYERIFIKGRGRVSTTADAHNMPKKAAKKADFFNDYSKSIRFTVI